jgi:peptide deformylase
MSYRILTIDNENDAKLLRRKAKKVENPQGLTLEVQAMKNACYEWEQRNGRRSEGIAAPQIGINLRVVLLRKNDTMIPRHPDMTPEAYDTVEGYRELLKAHNDFIRMNPLHDPWMVLVNPRIISTEGEQSSTEGCLSVPGSAYKVKRPEVVMFDYVFTSGKRDQVRVAQGFSAAAISHEIDHTLGVLICDIATEAYVGQEVGSL